MKPAKILAVLALVSAPTLAPTLALAEGCGFDRHQAQSCAPGTVYDADTMRCVEQPSS